MSFLRSLVTDLRERQIFPAVVLLLLLAIGIPVFASVAFSSSPTPAPISVPQVDTAPPAGTPAPSQETVDVSTAPAQPYTTYRGSEPNPFRAPAAAKTSAKSTTVSASSPSSSTSTTTPSSPPVSGTTTTTGSSAPTKTTTSSTTTTSAPATLNNDQAYAINGTATYASEKDTLDDLERLTPLPANADAEVVYLGVVKGGKRAAFLLTASVPATMTASSASVTCVPSASDCEVVELSAGENIQLVPSSSGSGVSTFTFKLDSIQATKYGTSDEANAAREAASAAGESIIAQSTSVGLASFFYSVNLGALVYEPQSSVGSSGTTGTTGATGATTLSGSTATTNGVAMLGADASGAFHSASR